MPGGPGAAVFCNSTDVLRMVQKLRGQNKWVACICAGPTVLIHAARLPGVWKREKCLVTSHPSVKQELIDADWEYLDEQVVVDDRVITARGYVPCSSGRSTGTSCAAESRTSTGHLALRLTAVPCRPGTALLFALTIVEMICGRSERENVSRPMMLPESS